jgi:DNA-directed RNA polymerase alpha subunit
MKFEDVRSGRTGDSFGLYFVVRSIRFGKQHEIYLYATRFEVSNGDLVLFDKQDKPYRAFSRDTWHEIATTSCLDGSEMWEEHDLSEVEEDSRLLRPVSELELSGRTRNCLNYEGIRTVGELVQLSVRDLLKKKNFGRASLNEIEAVLAEMGLSLAWCKPHPWQIAKEPSQELQEKP